MPLRIEVGFRPHIRDALGEKIKRRIVEDFKFHVTGVKTIYVYTIDAHLTPGEIQLIAKGPLSDPIIQAYSIDQPLAQNFDWVIEVGLKPGVTDNVGRTAKEAIEQLLNRELEKGEGVYTSVQYVISGNLTKEQATYIAEGLLGNPLIHRFNICNKSSWNKEKGMGVSVPKVRIDEKPEVAYINLNVDDVNLMKISRERLLALDLGEMKAIKGYFNDPEVIEKRKKVGLKGGPTDVELEALAQTWSEHCKHKIFNGIIHYTDETGKTMIVDSLFDTYIKGATEEIRKAKGKSDFCLSVFKDNAGVIKFNEHWSLAFKVETHNAPSALDPYGGALTGIVGVNRDPFGTGLGAKLIFNVDTFCFANPFYDKPIPASILHPKRIFEGVREGVEHGGNKSGIPTLNGSIVFDDRYLGRPLVYCGTCGLIPAHIQGRPSHIKQARPNDLIVMVGGRIGKDGIHGATFSSQALHEESPTAAVQIGDPITQRKMTDFLLVARDLGLYNSITDNGAGGLSSSVGEMALDTGGFELHLEKAPLKYSGLHPWEILLSESQERMTLAVDPKNIDTFLSLAERMGVEASVLGRFTDTGKFHVLYKGEIVAYVDMDFLHHGLPKKEMVAKWQKKVYPEPNLKPPSDLTSILYAMLSRLNICSKESVIRQYDHEVQGGSVVKPLVGIQNDGPSDAAVLRPLLDSWEGIVVSSGICPKYSDIDTYHMMACAIDEAVRNAIAVGGNIDHMAGLDNFCWCDPIQSHDNPDGQYKLAQLVRANQALYTYTRAYGIPCISGKDSMKNDYRMGDTKISIPPTVLFSLIGKIEDVRRTITMDAKEPADLVYILGTTYNEMGGSEYYAHHGFVGNNVPRVRAIDAKRLYQSLSQAIYQGLVASCHDCSDGGLAVALAETSFAGGLGMEIDLRSVPTVDISQNDILLFSESQSRFIVTIKPELKREFEDVMAGNVFAEIGRGTSDETFRITGLEGDTIIKASIYELKERWKKPLMGL